MNILCDVCDNNAIYFFKITNAYFARCFVHNKNIFFNYPVSKKEHLKFKKIQILK